MKLQLVRHATLLLDYAGMKILVDPMLSDVGAMAAIQNSPQPRPNPLVPLPFPVEQVLDGVQLVLVTHTHRDHWDDAAIQLVPKDQRQNPFLTVPTGPRQGKGALFALIPE